MPTPDTKPKAMTLKQRVIITTLLWSVFLVILAPAVLRGEPSTENRIKAAYLLNFARFVTWPEVAFESSVSPIVLCILGTDQIHTALPTIQYKRVQDRPLIIRNIYNTDDLLPCHMLYITGAHKQSVDDVLMVLNDSPILTISSLPDVSKRGVMITFVSMGNKIRFDVNLNTTQQAGLSISSRLLKLARLVPTP